MTPENAESKRLHDIAGTIGPLFDAIQSLDAIPQEQTNRRLWKALELALGYLAVVRLGDDPEACVIPLSRALPRLEATLEEVPHGEW